jgi:hypothetical protein
VLVELPEPLEPLLPEPDPVELAPADCVGAGVLGAVVAFVVVVLGLLVLVVVDFGVVVVFLTEANSIVGEGEPALRLAVVELELDAAFVCAVLNWSSAAVRFCSAWLSDSWAEVESSVASSWPLLTCCPALT